MYIRSMTRNKAEEPKATGRVTLLATRRKKRRSLMGKDWIPAKRGEKMRSAGNGFLGYPWIFD